MSEPVIPFHPLADLFPLIQGAEFEELVEDVREHGLRDHIDLLGGMVLDGRNRLRALSWLVSIGEVLGPGWGHRSGLPLDADVLEADSFNPLFKAFRPEIDGDPLAYVLSKNLKRRHLDVSQRAMVAAKLANMRQGERTDLPSNEGRFAISQAAAAEALHVGVASVERAAAVVKDGSDDLQRAVEQGDVSVSVAATLSQAPKDEQQKILEAAGGDEKKILAAASDIRARQRAERFAEVNQRLAAISENSKPLPTGQKYPIIYADPATKYVSGFSNRSAENHYPTMTTDELCALPVKQLATDDAVLLVWTTIPQLANTFDIARAWGFKKYCSAWCWDKVDQGPGHWAFNQHEELLIFTRGNFPAPVPGSQPRSLYAEKKTGHSAKPSWFAEQIERIWPDLPKIELFCRTPRAGWATWGNQSDIPSATEHDPAADFGTGQADVASADAARLADLSAPADPAAVEGARADAPSHAPPAFNSFIDRARESAHSRESQTKPETNPEPLGAEQAAKTGSPLPRGRSEAIDPRDDDTLDIPAFLRRRDPSDDVVAPLRKVVA